MNKLIALALVAGLSPFAFADGNSSTATAQASVTILAPVTVTAKGSLQFGKVVVSAVPTTIAIDSSAKISSADGNSVPYIHAGTTSIPTFSITKDESATVDVAFTPTFTAGTFTVDSAVLAGATSFAGSNGTAYADKPLYGSLYFKDLPHGTVTGSITITANYK